MAQTPEKLKPATPIIVQDSDRVEPLVEGTGSKGGVLGRSIKAVRTLVGQVATAINLTGGMTPKPREPEEPNPNIIAPPPYREESPKDRLIYFPMVGGESNDGRHDKIINDHRN